MTDYSVQIQFSANMAQLTPQIQGAVEQLQALTGTLQRTKPAEDGLRDGAKEAGDSVEELGAAGREGRLGMIELAEGTAIGQLAIEALHKSVELVKDFLREGIGFDRTMEMASLGIGTLIAAQTDLRDSNGQLLSGQEKVNAAIDLGKERMKELRIGSFQTIATVQQLTQAYELALGPMLAAGVRVEDTTRLTIGFAQAAGALHLDMNTLGHEMMMTFDGVISPRITKIAAVIGITGEQIRQWRALGTVAEELTKRLATYAEFGPKIQSSWLGVLSNVQHAWEAFAGEALLPAFDRLKEALNGALHGLFDLNSAEFSQSIQGLLGAVQQVAAIFGDGLAAGIKFAIQAAEDFSQWIDANKADLTSLVDQIKAMVEALVQLTVGGFGALLQVLGTVAVELGRHPVILGAIVTALIALKIETIVTSQAWEKFSIVLAATKIRDVAIQLTALAGAQGLTGLAAGLQLVGTRLVGMINPWVLAAAAIAAVAVGLSSWAQSYEKAAADKAEADLVMAQKGEQAANSFGRLSHEAMTLDERVRSTARGSRAHAEALAGLRGVVGQITQAYPEFINFLHQENGEYVNLAGSIEKFQAAKLRDLESKLEDEKAAAQQAKDNREDAQSRNIVSYALVYKGIAEDSDRELRAHNATIESLQRQIDTVKALKEVSTTNKPSTPEGPSPENQQAEVALELKGRLLQAQEAVTLEERKQKDLALLDLETDKERLAIQEKRKKGNLNAAQEAADLAKINELQAMKAKQIDQKYADEHTKIQEDLEGKLQAAEQGGLDQRLEAIRKNFDQIRELAKKAGGEAASEERIQAAEQAAIDRARSAQVKQDLAALKQELADVAQIKGRALTLQEQNELLAQFAQRSETARAAATRFRVEMHLDESAAQGWNAGLRQVISQNTNAWTTWKNTAVSMMNSVKSSMASALQQMMSGQLSFSQGMKAIWKGIVTAVTQALAEILAQLVVTKVAEALVTKKSKDAALEEASAKQISAAAGIFAADAGIPIVGPFIAAAGVAIMNATLVANAGASKAIARKKGGIAGLNGPELTVLGDGGEPELVSPPSDFADFAYSMTNLGARLQGAVERSRSKAKSYESMASSYAQDAARLQVDQQHSRGADTAPVVQVHFNGPILDSSNRGMQVLGRHVMDATRVAARQIGVTVRPGQTFGGL